MLGGGVEVSFAGGWVVGGFLRGVLEGDEGGWEGNVAYRSTNRVLLSLPLIGGTTCVSHQKGQSV